MGSVKDIKLYNKECYLLNLENYLNFIDKETGLTIKEININNNSVIDYMYNADVNDSVFDYYDNIEKEIKKEVTKIRNRNETEYKIKVA